MLRTSIFAIAVLLLVTSVVFSLAGMLAVWSPMELFGAAPR